MQISFERIFILLKQVSSIFSTRSSFFSTQLLLKTPMLELNNRLVFHRTWIVHIQSILEFLRLTDSFLVSDYTVIHRLSIYFPLHGFVERIRGRMTSAFYFSFSAEDRTAGSIPVQLWSFWALMSNTQI